MKVKGDAIIDDLIKMPNDGRKYELVDGEIVVTPAGMLHSQVAGNIFALLWNFVQYHSADRSQARDGSRFFYTPGSVTDYPFHRLPFCSASVMIRAPFTKQTKTTLFLRGSNALLGLMDLLSPRK